jgi:hypothetical protein
MTCELWFLTVCVGCICFACDFFLCDFDRALSLRSSRRCNLAMLPLKPSILRPRHCFRSLANSLIRLLMLRFTPLVWLFVLRFLAHALLPRLCPAPLQAVLSLVSNPLPCKQSSPSRAVRSLASSPLPREQFSPSQAVWSLASSLLEFFFLPPKSFIYSPQSLPKPL